MSEDLKTRLLKSIKQTGFPLELQVGSTFSKHGWGVQYCRYYIDRDLQKGREIDISGYLQVAYDEGDVHVSVGLHLICEVKWSKKRPWVIFSTNKGFVEGRGWLKLYYDNGVSSDDLSTNEIDKGSSVSKFLRIGRSYCEAFKPDDEGSVIFEALTSAVKASEHCREINLEALKSSIKDRYHQGSKLIYFVDPIVVIGGLLYEAYLNEKDELELDEVDHMLVSFGYISSEYQRRSNLVDIVTVKELPNLLSSKKKWLNGIKDAIVKKVTKKD
jgi:hypothetical protein